MFHIVSEKPHDNAILTQAMSDQQEKAQKERDAAESRHRQRQAELGGAQLELAVAKEDVRTARASRDAIVKDNDRLRKEIEKKAFVAQANIKWIIERFREQTRVAIEMATTTTLQSWAEQGELHPTRCTGTSGDKAELQVFRADKVNRDLRGPGFWKLDKANCEAVQKNLTTDFLRLAVSIGRRFRSC
jgi:hypothetical protein